MISFFPAIVGCIFVLTAILKAFYSKLFIQHVQRLQLLPNKLGGILSLSIIEWEMGVGVALIVGAYTDYAVLVAIGFLCLFSLITIWGLKSQKIEDCGCYGPLSAVSPNKSIIFNGVLIVLLLVFLINGEYRQPTPLWKIWWVIAAVLGTHFIAKKTLKGPLVDLLHLQTGKLWNKRVFDIGERQESFLIFFLDRRCSLCRQWIDELNDKTSKAFNLSTVVLYESSESISSLNQKAREMCHVQQAKGFVVKLLSGQLPLAIFVDKGVIKEKWKGDFPVEVFK